MSVKPYIFYHSHCTDGILATAVMMNYFTQNKKYVDYQVIPYNHGDKIDVNSLRLCKNFSKQGQKIFIEVYFLDILPGLDILRSVAETGCKIVILDHHKSAIPIIKTLLEETKQIQLTNINPETGFYDTNIATGIVNRFTNIDNHFDLKLSGCGLAWKWVGFQHQSRIWNRSTRNPLVELVQDRDLWNHYYKESNWVLSYLATNKKTVDYKLYMDELLLWDVDLTDPTNKILKSTTPGVAPLVVNVHGAACLEGGRKIFENYVEECNKIASRYTVRQLKHPKGVFTVAITECPGKYASAVGNILAELPGIDFSVSYEIVTEKNGGNSQCRGIWMKLGNSDPYIYLRARGSAESKLDLSDVIRFWDTEGSTGGGHMKAAGSTSTFGKFYSSFCDKVML